MKKKRRRFSSEFKLKIILEALQERSSTSELAQKHELHPNQISQWKSSFIANARQYMKPAEGTDEKDQLLQKEKLYAKIGRLEMENDYLKKRLS